MGKWLVSPRQIASSKTPRNDVWGWVTQMSITRSSVIASAAWQSGVVPAMITHPGKTSEKRRSNGSGFSEEVSIGWPVQAEGSKKLKETA